MSDSIFTKIIKGEIPCYKVYEDETTFAFLDIHPVQPGHVLVVPKAQIEFLWDLDDETYKNLMLIARKLARRLKEVTAKPYIGMKVVGEDIPHTHVHLIPFSTAAEFNSLPDMTTETDGVALAALAKKLAM